MWISVVVVLLLLFFFQLGVNIDKSILVAPYYFFKQSLNSSTICWISQSFTLLISLYVMLSVPDDDGGDEGLFKITIWSYNIFIIVKHQRLTVLNLHLNTAWVYKVTP